MFGRKNKGGLMPMPAPPPEAVAAPRRGLFGGRSNMGLADFIMLAGATAKDISDGGTANFGNTYGFIQDRRDKAAAAPFEEAKRQLAMEAMRRQMQAYGVADASQLTPEEQIALAFNPEELGKTFASGSERATLGRNDRSIFRGREVIRNDAPADPQVVAPGASLVNDEGTPIFRAPQFQAVPESSRLVQTDPGTQGGSAAGGGWDSFYQNFVAPQEGGFAADDGNGAPVNFGINQGANPDVDVRNLSQDQAKQLLHDRYWAASGADRLPPGVAEVHGDTAINMGVGAAQQLLAQSGGDPQRYLELREQRYRAIAQNDPGKARFLPTWLRRNQQLAQYVGGAPQAAAAAPAGSPRVVVDAAPKRQVWSTLPAEQSAQYGPGSYQLNTETGEIRQVPGTAPKGGGRATAAVLALQDDHLDALQIATGVQANLQKYAQQIATGKLNLGPVANIVSQGRNLVGASDPNSRNFASFRAGLEKLRNDSLRLNKGVQTEGDAVRAWNELLANINDEKVVLQRLQEINQLNERAVMFRQAMVSQIREDAGLSPLDPNKFMVRPQQGGAAPARPPQRAAAPAAPAPAQRKAGQTYQTPKGPLKWTGTGWVKP